VVASFRGGAGTCPLRNAGLTGSYYGRRGFNGEQGIAGKDKFKRVDPGIHFISVPPCPALPEGVAFPATDEFPIRWKVASWLPPPGNTSSS